MTAPEWFILGFATAAAIVCLRAWHLWEKEIKRAQQQHDVEPGGAHHHLPKKGRRVDELDHQTYRRIMDRRGIEIVRDSLTEQQIVDRASGHQQEKTKRQN